MENWVCESNLTLHAIERAKQRVDLNKKKASRIVSLAWQRGVRYNQCRWSDDKKYLLCKTNEKSEAVAFNGYCFIFSKETGVCITMFSLPKDFGKKKTRYNKEKMYY